MIGILLAPEKTIKSEKNFAEADGYLYCKNCKTVTPQKEYRRTMRYKCLICGRIHYAAPHTGL